MNKFCATLLGLFLFALPALVQAGRPMEEVKSTADKVLAILNDASLKGDVKKDERRRQMHTELDRRFDWALIAKGCLGRHWTKRTWEEQNQFITLFTQLLEDTYLGKIETYYTDLDKLNYQGEKIIDTYASVKVVIATKQGLEHPVEYRLEKATASGDWRVYDILIEGVSLVKNYRTQFDEILAKSTFDQLLAELKAKLAKNKE